MNKKISEIGDRAKSIFKLLVENYIATGEPLGSKSISSQINNQLSPATIRSVLNEINLYGLIKKDHFSAGSIPTDLGLHFYTQALLEPGTLKKNEKKLIDSTSLKDLPEEYEKITNVLNGLSNQASLVINDEKIPKIKKIDFHKIDNQKVIFIIENEDGTTINRLVETKENIDNSDLNIISNFLDRFISLQLPSQIEKNISKYISETQNQINETTRNLLQNGIKLEKSNKSEKFFVRGLPNLIKNELETDLDSLNELLSEIETGKMATKMIQALKKSKGVQIFIGSNTNLFKNANLSMIFSSYQTKNGLTGAIGVIGPKRIDYQRIVPIVSYMSEIISKKSSGEKMNEDNNKDVKTSEENKTDESQIEEINEKDEVSNENDNDSPENIIEKLNEEIQDLKDQRLRAAAELENFRKRAEKDQSDALKYGVSNFAKEIISIKDNIERAQSSISDDVRSNDDVKSVVEGLDLIAQSAVSTFEKIGIKKIDSLNEKFDHNLHQAMMEIENDQVEPGTIVQELIPGYTLHDRLLRPAMVGVAKKTQQNQQSEEKEKEEN